MAKKPVIRASEVGAYVYCRRAWWLRRVGGFEPQNTAQRLAEGTAAHVRHGQSLRRAQLLRRVALTLVVMAIVMLLLALLVIKF
jgi:CRISPR/Cas system-associated exonuclease Cas4 (RecB family)